MLFIQAVTFVDLPVMAAGESTTDGVLPVLDLEALIGDAEPDAGALRDAVAEALEEGQTFAEFQKQMASIRPKHHHHGSKSTTSSVSAGGRTK